MRAIKEFTQEVIQKILNRLDVMNESLVYPNVANNLDTSLTSYTPTKNGYLVATVTPTEANATLTLILPSGYQRRALMATTVSNAVVDIYVKAGDTVLIGPTRCRVASLVFYTND